MAALRRMQVNPSSYTRNDAHEPYSRFQRRTVAGVRNPRSRRFGPSGPGVGLQNLGQTLQEMLGVARRVIVAFPNFGHWRAQ
jgi:hypothetical protein